MFYNSREQVEVIRKALRRGRYEVVVGVENKKEGCLGHCEFKAPLDLHVETSIAGLTLRRRQLKMLTSKNVCLDFKCVT